MKIKVTICEDHRIVREGLREILRENPDMEVVDAVDDAESLIASLHKNATNVILLDISLPGRSGIDVLKQLQESFPRVSVLMLSMHPASQFAVRAIRSGAKGFLNKDADPEELKKAIKVVAKGNQYISEEVAGVLYRKVANKEIAELHESLSDREYEVLLLLGQGKSTSEIADILNLSAKTISTYRSRIYEKLKVSNLAELIQYLISKGLLISD